MGKSLKKAPENKVSIDIDDVLRMLINEGKTRDEIGEHYSLNKANQTALFRHDRLKGVKTKGNPAKLWFTIVDKGADTTAATGVADSAKSSDGTEKEATKETEKVAEKVELTKEDKW